MSPTSRRTSWTSRSRTRATSRSPTSRRARPCTAAAAELRQVLAPAQRWALLGGDHTTTASVVEVALEHYPDLRVVQFDAHPDLRGEYLGEAWNYASAMTRVLDHLGPDRLYQIGLRTGDREEWEPPRGTHVFPGWAGSAADAAASIAGELSGQPLYVTIDIDVLDPSIAPGTGAPEPGGHHRARSPRGAPAPRRRAGDRLRRGGGLPALGPVGPDGNHGRRDRARRDPDVVGAPMTPAVAAARSRTLRPATTTSPSSSTGRRRPTSSPRASGSSGAARSAMSST